LGDCDGCVNEHGFFGAVDEGARYRGPHVGAAFSTLEGDLGGDIDVCS
jgi:hypothetical protein